MVVEWSCGGVEIPSRPGKTVDVQEQPYESQSFEDKHKRRMEVALQNWVQLRKEGGVKVVDRHLTRRIARLISPESK